jgi:hypothetical protein
MKITRKQLRKLIKEFKINPDYTSFFDFSSLNPSDGGGDNLPPLPPDDNGGGGGGRGSNYPQILIDKLVNGKLSFFSSGTTYGMPDVCTADLSGSILDVAADNQTSSIQIMFSFYVYDLGQTEIVDLVSFSCDNQSAVNDLYNRINRLRFNLKDRTEASLNREIDKLGIDFISRYMSNVPGDDKNE